jgi:hypothetical protein
MGGLPLDESLPQENIDEVDHRYPPMQELVEQLEHQV